eukprot:TRINITY_DN4807_c0_g1_i1.p1 TRINITY_DN4807_c0_g1~~TRINITY_DN4807_c0_g1_i1.p1  ORF type:complete len:149 (-),score=29.62 TRINITY_DN4807_c0_g1_i1:116-508(-)
MSILVRSVSRFANTVPKRSLVVSSTMRADQQMMDPLEHATGLEKYELLAKQAGNMDPFFLRAVSRSKGTKDSPTIVHAMDNYRMVGCVCNEEDTNIKWTWLCEGVPKRCECGYWMELKSHPAPEKYQLPL